MACDDYDRKPAAKAAAVSHLDPFKAKIDEWLEEDRRMRFKQRHTAKRTHERLREEFLGSYDCSYTLVQRYIKARKAGNGNANGALDLVWAPGEAQADFGEADVLSDGNLITIKYLVLSFPASNAGYMQAFSGETAERFEKVLTDGYGKFCLDGRHWYTTSPDLSGRELVPGKLVHRLIERVFD